MGYSAIKMDDALAPPRLRPFGDRDHDSARRLKQAHECFQTQDFETLFSIFADDIAWHVPGDNVLSGTFIGRDGIMQNFQTLFANVDAYWAYPLDYFGSDDHAVLVARVRAKRGDRLIDVEECLLFRVGPDGRFTNCWHLCLDEAKWNAFFAKEA